MRKLLRLFRVSNIILCFALVLFVIGIKGIYEAYGKQAELKQHTGIVETKSFGLTKHDDRDSLKTVRIKLHNDENYYSIAMSAEKVNTLVNEGDSVELFTKAVINKKGNQVTNGSMFWYSTDPNQVFQIISKKYEQPVVAIDDYQHSLKTGAWIAPFISACCFIVYFFRRLNNKGFFTFSTGNSEVTIE